MLEEPTNNIETDLRLCHQDERDSRMRSNAEKAVRTSDSAVVRIEEDFLDIEQTLQQRRRFPLLQQRR